MPKLSMASPLILASRSPRRQHLLTALGIPFQIFALDIPEVQRRNENPTSTALRLCLEKHAAARASHPGETLILTADTVVALWVGDRWRQFGKPRNPEDAYYMIRNLAQKEHLVHTAFALSAANRRYSQVVTSRVWLRRPEEEELRRYCASSTPYDKAGGYAIQDPCFQPVERIHGSYSNVMGLPLEALVTALQQFEVSIPFANAQLHNAPREHEAGSHL